MKVFSLSALEEEPSDPNTFAGLARLTRMNAAADQPPTYVYRVVFEGGARTNWHSHSGPQLLQIVDGVCRYQTDGEAVREAAAGDLIAVDAGERHWHGASPAGPMTHIAINIDATTSWFGPVSDPNTAADARFPGDPSAWTALRPRSQPPGLLPGPRLARRTACQETTLAWQGARRPRDNARPAEAERGAGPPRAEAGVRGAAPW